MAHFKTIPGFSDYKINNSGKVINKDGNEVKARDDRNKYKRVDLYRDGKRYTHFIHTLVNRAFNGGKSKEVDHKNNNRSDNRAENLRDISRSDNMKKANSRRASK